MPPLELPIFHDLAAICHLSSEERLNGLALAYIHRDINVNLDRVLQKWDGSGHRRIHLAFASNQKC